MKKDIVVNVSPLETRIAVLEDDVLVELHVDRLAKNSLVGTVYKARVLNLMTGLKAAFVNLGLERNGFLPLDEIPFEDFAEMFEGEIEMKEKPRPEHLKLKENQEIIVQITKDSYGVKGPRVTSYISIAGRNVVLLVNARNVGVSRKIHQRNQREALFKLGREIRPKDMGLIMRTAALQAKPDEVHREVRMLVAEWEECLKKAQKPAPILLTQEPEILLRITRDQLNQEVRNMIIDDEVKFRELGSYLSKVAPKMRPRLKRYTDPQPIFQKYGIEDQLKKIFERKIWLASGGYIVIDQAEAFLAIDVNTGKSSREKQAEQLAFNTNIEALREIARQLRLRDIGGLVVVDLIDLERRENIDRMIREFRSLIRQDRARYRLGGISEFGLLQFTRERSRISLTLAMSEPCPICKGRGRIMAKITTFGYVERWFQINARAIKNRMVELQVSPRLSDYLMLSQTEALAKMATEHNFVLKVKPDYSIPDDDFKVTVI